MIDARAPRVNQAFVGLACLLAFLLQAPVLVALVALQLAVGLLFGRRYCLPCVFYFEVLQPRLGEGPLEDARPPRFANILGCAFTSVATLAFLAGFEALGWALALLVAALALLAASTGFCLGCEIYTWFARRRGIPLREPPSVPPAGGTAT